MSRYKPYPKYKESGVVWLGEVPEEWDVVPARNIVNNLVEKNENAKDQRYLSLMANVGIIKYEDKGDIGNKKPEDLSKCKIVRKGNLVINSMNYSIGSFGMSPYDGVCSPVYVVLGIKEDIVVPQFALRLFENKSFQQYAASFGNGILAHRAAIGWDELKGAYLPLPSLNEQTTIANFLDRETAKIDTLIGKQERLIELLQEKRQALISHAVTKGLDPNVKMKESGVAWLGEVPEHWEVMKIKYWGTYKSGDFISADQIEDDGNYPVMGGNGLRGFASKYNLEGNFVLIGRQGALCGNINYASGKFWATEHAIVVFHNNRIDNILWLGSMLETMNLNQYSVSAAQPGLAVENIINLESVLPPKDEQKQIADYLDTQSSKIDTLVEKAKQAIKLLKERRTALISAAVTGKIDVREVAV